MVYLREKLTKMATKGDPKQNNFFGLQKVLKPKCVSGDSKQL